MSQESDKNLISLAPICRKLETTGIRQGSLASSLFASRKYNPKASYEFVKPTENTEGSPISLSPGPKCIKVNSIFKPHIFSLRKRKANSIRMNQSNERYFNIREYSFDAMDKSLENGVHSLSNHARTKTNLRYYRIRHNATPHTSFTNKKTSDVLTLYLKGSQLTEHKLSSHSNA